MAAASYWSGPSRQEIRPQGFGDPGGLADFFHVRAAAGLSGAVADERHTGVDAELLGGFRALDGDVGERLGIGIRVHGAVAIDEHLLGQAHEEDGGDDARAGAGLDELQRGPDGVGGRVHRTGNQAVHLAHGEHHGAEHDVVFQRLERVVLVEVLVFAHLHQRRDVARAQCGGVEDLDFAGNRHAIRGGHAVDFLAGCLTERSGRFSVGRRKRRPGWCAARCLPAG